MSCCTSITLLYYNRTQTVAGRNDYAFICSLSNASYKLQLVHGDRIVHIQLNALFFTFVFKTLRWAEDVQIFDLASVCHIVTPFFTASAQMYLLNPNSELVVCDSRCDLGQIWGRRYPALDQLNFFPVVV